MNDAILSILDHRSVRSFKDIPLTEQQITKLITVAQSASSASFQQAYSIIGVSDKLLKEEIRKHAGKQEFIVKNGHLLVFCVDFYRHVEMAMNTGVDISDTINGIDSVIAGTVDASLAAQNMAIAAESMGLGICYVGGVRDGVIGVSECLGIPNHVFPIFGFVVGYPEQINEQKPRLPLEVIYHENRYESDLNKLNQQLSQYDNLMAKYYQRRSANKRHTIWSEHTMKKSQRHSRTFMKNFINEKGLAND